MRFITTLGPYSLEGREQSAALDGERSGAAARAGWPARHRFGADPERASSARCRECPRQSPRAARRPEHLRHAGGASGRRRPYRSTHAHPRKRTARPMKACSDRRRPGVMDRGRTKSRPSCAAVEADRLRAARLGRCADADARAVRVARPRHRRKRCRATRAGSDAARIGWRRASGTRR